MPVRTLAAFERINLEPGESRRVTVDDAERQMSHWNTTKKSWVRPRGQRGVYVGSSSRYIR